MIATTAKIESNDLTLAEVYQNFYTVPDFQREYVWQTDNVEKLLQDVYDEFFDADGQLVPSPEYFIGSIVTCSDNGAALQLIDGQQRLTTTYLVLCAIRDELLDLGADVPNNLKQNIADLSMDPTTGDDVPLHRLVLQYQDSQGVLATLADRTVPIDNIVPTTASVRNILSAYRTAREFLGANFQGNPSAVKKFYAAITTRVKLIRIKTPDLTRALKVFETINDRGVGLNSMDLLKNLLFMKTSSTDYPNLKGRWKHLIDTLNGCGEKPLRFLRYYVMSQYDIDLKKPLREDEIYGWFASHQVEAGIAFEPLAFLDRLVSSAEAYACFASSMNVDGSTNPYLRNIYALSYAARQHFILLLAGQHLPHQLFTELCRHIENVFFCYLITREPTKNFERNFARWAKDLRAVSDLEGLNAFVARYFTPDLAMRSNSFDFAFRELDQTRIQQYRLRYVLAKLTQYIEERAWSNSAHSQLDQYLSNAVHVEHILPQDPTPEIRNAFDKPLEYDQYKVRLGNLTLLEKTINSSVSNGNYEQKKPGYRHSSFLLTKSLVETPHVGTNTQLNRAVADLIQFDTWDSDAVELRQQMLGELARHVWQIPTPHAGEVS